MIVYYTDGSCEPNPGTGGFAVIRLDAKGTRTAPKPPKQSISTFSTVNVSMDMSPLDKKTYASVLDGLVHDAIPFTASRDMKPQVLGGDFDTTNIRMEGLAIIAALKDANGEHCEIYTDSEFWINVITKWSIAWETNGWKKKGGHIKNLDIVQEVCPLHRSSNAVLVWVRGHNNDPGNELADEWANKARAQQLAKKA